MGKAHQQDKHPGREDGEHNGSAADDRADISGPFFTEIPGNEHGDAHGKLSDDEGHQIHYLAAGGYGGKTGSGAKLAHHQQVNRAVGCLQDQGAQHGEHKQGQLFQNTALGKIIVIQE